MRTLGICLTLLLIYSCDNSFNCKKMFETQVKPIPLNGIVISKFRDAHIHDEPRIKFNNNNRIDTLISLTDLDKSHLYDSIQSGDSIIKARGSLDFKIVRKKEVKIFKVGCY